MTSIVPLSGMSIAHETDELSLRLHELMQTVEAAKRARAAAKATLEGLELMLAAGLDGKNAETRKAQLWAACHDDKQWLDAQEELERNEQELAKVEVERDWALARLGACKALLRFFAAMEGQEEEDQ